MSAYAWRSHTTQLILELAIARRAGLALFALVLAGCASLPPQGPRQNSHALENPESTRFGQEVANRALRSSDSGFRLVISGDDAYTTLRQLIGQAERTLDLQYYLIEDDTTTQVILREVRQAADRGVRVRLLVDDLHTAGRDGAWLRFATHPNIEVRLFNPFPVGRGSLLTRVMASAFDARRINRRMHNKITIADNSLCLTGGRNLGARYFLRDEANNFVDLDVLAAGAIVGKLSQSFDRYWNDELSYPIQSLVGTATARTPDESVEAASAPPALPEPDDRFWELAWIPGHSVSDDPGKATSETERPASDETLIDDIGRMLREARAEVIIVTPYFVPGEKGLARIKAIRARGLRVRVLTNSLASTDAPIVHGGYARYRSALLEAGVEIHELRPTLSGSGSQIGAFGSSQASLHSKAIVVDRRVLFVGSMNLDQRSISQNTEMGLFMRGPELAETIVALFEETTQNDSYRVESASGQLRWITQVDGREMVHEREPEAGLLRRIESYLLGPFAPEELL